MKPEVILVKEALALIKNNKFAGHYKVDFKNHPVDALDAILDNPEITDQDFVDGKVKWLVKTEIPLNAEIREWIGTENINLGEFAAKLIQTFYDNIKTLPKRNTV